MIPRLIQEVKGSLGENPSVDALVANWDALNIPKKYLDYVGCCLPWDPKTQAGTNARKFIRDQSEHHETYIYCATVSTKPSKKQKSQSTLPKRCHLLHLTRILLLPQSSIAGKVLKKHLKQGSLDNFLKVAPLVGEASKRSHVKSKGFC